MSFVIGTICIAFIVEFIKRIIKGNFDEKKLFTAEENVKFSLSTNILPIYAEKNVTLLSAFKDCVEPIM